MKQYFISILLTFLYQPGDFSMKYNDVFYRLSAQTPYRFVANKNDAIIKYPGCKPKKIWMMIRHGTRYPNDKDIEDMITELPKLKNAILSRHHLGNGNLTKEQISSLKKWECKIKHDMEMKLAPEGQDEMKLLAERMKNRFPDVIKDKYDNRTFLFRYTATERTRQSAKYFANGLFDKKQAEDVIFPPAKKIDTVLRFYKHCEKWLKEVKQNPATYAESKKFAKSQEMNTTLTSVSKRLGLNEVLTFDQVLFLYKTCGFETSWYKQSLSPWCAAFDEEDRKLFEYYFDLVTYWRDGYAYELTYRQACMAFKNMYEHLTYENGPKAVFNFAHSGTILKIIAHLGLYKPASHLTADMKQVDREWKTSDINSFASNIAFVLFSCKDGDHVLTMYQERPIKLPLCKNELCSLKHLTEYYHNSLNKCDFYGMCTYKRDEF